MPQEAIKFSKEKLQYLLSLLNERLEQAGVTGEICIVGGAAMILAFGNRNSTKDIDALLIAPAEVREAARRVAEAEGISSNWLNDGAKGFASAESAEAVELLKHSHLRVMSPRPEYILAMKCIAARVGLDETDKTDVRFLIGHLQLKNAGEVLRVVERYYPKSRIPAKTAYFVEEVFNELNEASGEPGRGGPANT